MHSSILRYFNIFRFARKLEWINSKTPIAICLSFFILSIIGINNHFITQKPPLFLLPFFYWMTKKPENMGLLYVLIIAFIYDVLDNNFFGVNIFLIMIMYYFLLYQKFIPINRNRMTHYITFALIVAFYYIIKYVIYSYMFSTKPDITYIIFNYSLMLVLYPAVYLLMQKIDKYIK